MPRYVVSLGNGKHSGFHELEFLRTALNDGRLPIRPDTKVAPDTGIRWVQVQTAIDSGQPHYVQGRDHLIYGPISAGQLRTLCESGRISPSAFASPADWAWQPLKSVHSPMRHQRERDLVRRHFPTTTRHLSREGRDVWIFKKATQLGIVFEIAIYMDPDEGGYVAQLVSPELEEAWRNPHIAHIFKDGVLCLGTCKINGVSTMRATNDMLTAFAKSCLWAEAVAVMLRSKQLGTPVEFPFSNNNKPDEVS